MTRTVIIGGHGKVALLAAPLLAEAGHDVVSLIRNPDHAEDVRAAGAEPLVLDIEKADQEELVHALRDADNVVFSAGAGGGTPSAPGPWTTTPPSPACAPPRPRVCGAT